MTLASIFFVGHLFAIEPQQVWQYNAIAQTRKPVWHVKHYQIELALAESEEKEIARS